MNDIPKDILNECSSYAEKFVEEESCGVIISNNKGLLFKPCKNQHYNKQNFFLIDPQEFINNDVRYVFHSHWNIGCRPSSFDKKNCSELCIPFLIYSLYDKQFYLYDNMSV